MEADSAESKEGAGGIAVIYQQRAFYERRYLFVGAAICGAVISIFFAPLGPYAVVMALLALFAQRELP